MIKLFHQIYHWLWAVGSAAIYRFPSRKLFVIGITGTKGKSTTAELINAILEEAGYRTALASTVRTKIDNHSEPNLKKMSMPGRGWLQKFFHRALQAGCTHAVIEMTSQGAPQYRHRGINLNAFVFTNLAPEHIESHGSYENYRAAKIELARQLLRSRTARPLLIINGDDPESAHFAALGVADTRSFRLAEAPDYVNQSSLIGDFNKYNILAAGTLAEALGISRDTITRAIKKFKGVAGRMEKVAGAPFEIIVDYAHTPDSLEAVYKSFPHQRKICVLGGTGGGRDSWKRPVMGEIAGRYCDQIFFTDEDPYDEDPEKIVKEVAAGVKDSGKYKIIMDRREAIRQALKTAQPGDVVLITGKGTDPYIMRAAGTKEPWSDKGITTEELAKIS